MGIFIAKDYEGVIESMVLARNAELANAYWQGKEIYPHSVSEFSEKNLEDHPTGVLPLLKVYKMKLSAWSKPEREYSVLMKD